MKTPKELREWREKWAPVKVSAGYAYGVTGAPGREIAAVVPAWKKEAAQRELDAQFRVEAARFELDLYWHVEEREAKNRKQKLERIAADRKHARATWWRHLLGKGES
jgi:hypothetical protein